MKYWLKLKLKIIIEFAILLKSIILLTFYKIIPGVNRYQPIYNSVNEGQVTRLCYDRWRSIEKVVPKKKGSMLDIGSNIGYFTFKFSEKGFLSHGVESDVFNIIISNSIKEKNKINNAIFSQDIVDEKFIEKMPYYFLINNLSVFHHWVKRFGQEKAIEMLKNISKNCECMFFETGQNNEKKMSWSKSLEFMGDDSRIWVRDKFKEFGFKKIEVIGQFPTGLSKVNRYLFFAKK